MKKLILMGNLNGRIWTDQLSQSHEWNAPPRTGSRVRLRPYFTVPISPPASPPRHAYNFYNLFTTLMLTNVHFCTSLPPCQASFSAGIPPLGENLSHQDHPAAGIVDAINCGTLPSPEIKHSPKIRKSKNRVIKFSEVVYKTLVL